MLLGFSSSKSSNASSSQANTTSTYNTTDQRQGVDGSGNLVAGQGANVSVVDNSEYIAETALAMANQTADAALRAQMDTARASLSAQADTAAAALTSNARVSDSAFRTVGDVTGQAITNAQRSVDTVSKTFTDLSADQVNLLAQVVRTNADTTDAAQKRNADLATSFLEKSVTAIADSKTDTNEKIVNNAVEYGAYAAIAIAIAFGLLAMKRSK